MKRYLFLLTFIPFVALAQPDEYYRTVDWKFVPDNVIRLTDTTYVMDASPIDYNDPGAISRTVGNYVVDYIGHRYAVIDSTLTTLTVLDIYHTGQAPQSWQMARCYRSVGHGEAKYIGSIDYSPLDESSRWKLNGSDNELLWRHGIEYDSPFKRLVIDTLYGVTGLEPKGTTYFNSVDGTMNTTFGDAVVYQWGEELFMRGQNDTGSELPDGTPVMYAGSIGNSGNFRISKAYASPTIDVNLFVGITTQHIQNGKVGRITTHGKVRGIKTNGSDVGETWLAGDILYLSTSPGKLTKVKPQAPVPAIVVALVISSHATNGTLEVRPTLPDKLSDLADVNGTPLTITGQIPVWDNTHKYFDFNYNLLDIKGESTDFKDTIYQAAHGFSLRDALYLNDKYYKANADTIITADAIGMVSEVISADSFVIQTSGIIEGSYVKGTNYFLSNTVDGLVEEEPAYNIGDIRLFMGTGIGNGQLLLEIDLGYEIMLNTPGSSSGDTISSMYYSNDTLYVTESGNLWKAEIVGGSGSGSSTLFEKELANNETVVNTGFLIDSNCLVWLNGELLPSANWSGEGTMNVTLSMGINQYDQLIVYKSSLPISELFEAELANNQTTVDVGFTPTATTIIFFNGQALQSDRWSSVGTQITLDFPVSEYDKLIAKN